MDRLKDRLDRELDELSVPPRSASDVIAVGARRKKLRKAATIGVASVAAVGSIVLISRAFDDSSRSVGGDLPREERIVFNTVPWPDIAGQIFTVRPDGTGLERLTKPDAEYLAPAVSPDGSRIAFVRFERGSDSTGSFHEGIFVMNVDGSGMHEVLRTGEPKPISVSQIAWSPDGSEIAFVRIFYVGSSEADFRNELWIMGTDGSDPHRLIDREIESFSWSPDGSQIAFTEQSVVGNRFQWDLHVMSADGSNVQPLTDDGRSRFPAWSPDGTKIAFQRWVEYDEKHLYVLEPNDPGSDPRPIWTGGEGFDTIAWSPDSARIAIDTFDQREERCSLLTVTLDGDTFTVLESQRPEPMPGGAGQSSLCAGTLAWSLLRTGGESDAAADDDTPGGSGDLIVENITIADALNAQSEVQAQVDMSWSRPAFPGVRMCTFIARDGEGHEVGRYEDLVFSLNPSASFPIKIGITSPARSVDGECGPRLDVGVPYRYDMSDIRVTGNGLAVVEFDANWAADGQAGAVTCRLIIRDEAGSIVGAERFNLVVATGSASVTERTRVRGTPAEATLSCVPFEG